MRRYGYRHNPDEYTCPNCPELFVMQPDCIVYSGTCDSCSTVFSAKRNADGTISVRIQLLDDIRSGRVLQFNEGTAWWIEPEDVVIDNVTSPFGYATPGPLNTIGIIDETCVTPEPLFTREPYKCRSLVSMLDEFDKFFKHYRGDYDG